MADVGSFPNIPFGKADNHQQKFQNPFSHWSGPLSAISCPIGYPQWPSDGSRTGFIGTPWCNPLYFTCRGRFKLVVWRVKGDKAVCGNVWNFASEVKLTQIIAHLNDRLCGYDKIEK